jgi:predicted RNA-binding protein YlxR (DUF448 family)
LAAKPIKRPKHLPQRTCVGCRAVRAKKGMIRIVRLPEGVQVDLTGKMAGRGAYLHNTRPCWEKGLKGQLAHALKTTLTASDINSMQEFIKSLPEDAEGNDEQA